MKAETVTVKIKPKIEVDEKTVHQCIRVLELWMSESEEILIPFKQKEEWHLAYTKKADYERDVKRYYELLKKQEAAK